MNQIRTQVSSIEQMADQYLNKQKVTSQTSDELSFEKILQQKQQNLSTAASDTDQSVKFSKHAASRLTDRNISLSQEQTKRLEDGVSKASQKGIKESLVLMDSMAFIVNVPNKTVVTAMDQSETDSNVFTNIDGAVII